MDLSEVTRFEIATDTRKLSQLIRDGAKLRPQCRQEFFSHDGGSCALGAAYEARYGETTYSWWSASYVARKLGVPVGVCRDIARMNDDGHTREECADYAERFGY